MRTRAVFFDLGGTLLVMRRDRIYQRVLRQEGLDAPLERIHSAYKEFEPWWLSSYASRRMSPGETQEAYRHLDEKVFGALFPDKASGEGVRLSRLVRKRWPDLEKQIPLELYPDVEPALSRLSGLGLYLGLISNAPAGTERVAEALGLRRFMRSIIISGAVGYSKPHPGIFRIALADARVAPSEAVHVGDVYEADVVGAGGAGMRGVLIDRDSRSAGIDCLRVKSLAEVEGYL